MNATISFLLSRYVELIIVMICEKYGYTEQVALRQFLFSKTYKMLATPKLEMWEFTPEVIFDMWECERITGEPRNTVYIREA